MPLQATSGAASYDAFGGGTVAKVNYIEDFFQSYLRTGTGASAPVTTGLDGSTKETLVWTKSRSAATNHKLTDNVRGATKALSSNTTGAEATDSQGLTAFSATGYTIGTNTDYNNSGATYVDWQWVSQPKFFDIVTWTGDGTGNRSIPHLLGSTPAFIQTKLTSGVDAWWNHHSSVTSPNANWWRNYGFLDGTAAFADWGDNSGLYQAPDATNLYIGSYYNGSGKTYVAYLFAHNAGGFGLTGTDNVISCGSYTGTSAVGNAQTLGYEPQWILIKNITTAGYDWTLIDTMRGWATNGADAELYANSSSAEYFADNLIDVTATGFNFSVSGATALNTSGNTYIYIAIRRGPMKVPSTGSSVYGALAYSGNSTSGRVISTGIDAPDLAMMCRRNLSGAGFTFTDRLRNTALGPWSTDPESGFSQNLTFVNQGDASIASFGNINQSTYTYIGEFMKRAPSFMDVVCYTGTGSSMSLTHNLGVGPELVIIKRRNSTSDWQVAAKINSTEYTVGASGNELALNSSGGGTTTYFTYATYFNSTTFQTGAFWTSPNVNTATYVAYLFATCAGVSKVGSYTGNGSSQTINCGFTGGARFVLIKKSSGTGDWMVSDSARGIVSGSDPYLELNNTNAEVTGEDWLDTDSTGFVVNEVSGSNANTNGATYIFLAIA